MLHESFQNPERDVAAPPYELTEVGWGEFDIIVRLHFRVRCHSQSLVGWGLGEAHRGWWAGQRQRQVGIMRVRSAG